MATSGRLQTATISNEFFYVDWSVSEVDTPGNRSKIHWVACAYLLLSYRSNAVRMGAVTINGSQVRAQTTYSNVPNGGYAFASGDIWVAHNSDGTKTLSVSIGACWLYSNTNFSAVSGSYTLNKIPKQGTITATNADIGSKTTINVSKPMLTYTTTITASWGTSGSATVATKTQSTTIDWTVPTSIYSTIPNAKSTVVTLTCTTYDGNTQIGSASTTTFTATAGESTCKPTLNPTAVDSNSTTRALTGDQNKFIYGLSNAQVSTGAQAKNSATIVSQSITCDGNVINSGSGTFTGVTSGTFVFTVTDSRGYQTTQTLNKTLINYLTPTCTLSVGDVSGTGGTTLTINGVWFNGKIGTTTNTLTTKYRYKTQGGSYGNWITFTPTKSGNTYSATVNVTGLDYTKLYVFQAQAIDKYYTSGILSAEVSKRSLPLWWWNGSKFEFYIEPQYNGAALLTATDVNTAITTALANIGTIYTGTWSSHTWNTSHTEKGRISNLPKGKYIVSVHVDFNETSSSNTRLLSRMYIDGTDERLGGVDFMPAHGQTNYMAELTYSAIADITSSSDDIVVDGYSYSSITVKKDGDNYICSLKAIRIA